MTKSILSPLIGWLLLSLLILQASSSAHAQNDWSTLQNGGIVLFRHANAPGTGDPANFRLNDCTTQRNLDDAGRAQARRIGEQFRARNIAIGKVLTSQWCRCRETAQLAFPGLPKDEPAFNSFFSDRSTEAEQSKAARQILIQWRGPGVLVIVTHQVNITALTDIVPESGEGIVLRVRDGKVEVVGRIKP